MTQITKHLEDLKQLIGNAALAAGRSETEVSILAVSKRHSIESIREAQAAGLQAMGENYLQEALEKIRAIDPPIDWHFIGRIQSNKTRLIAENFQWVQTVDSERIAKRLNEQRPAQLEPLNVCIQVRIDNSDHGGLDPAQVLALARFVSKQPRLHLRGLMTIPLAAENPAEQHQPFRQMKQLFDELNSQELELDTLSMGMSGDYEAAIAEGSTMLRIGTALFGTRPM